MVYIKAHFNNTVHPRGSSYRRPGVATQRRCRLQRLMPTLSDIFVNSVT